jgi:formylglycine-generating enzyme required for sulfatase activity
VIVGEPVEMVLIPAGTFQMGSNIDPNASYVESPVHSVTLSSYYMGKYELTNGKYVEFLNDVRGNTDQVTLDNWFSVDPNDYCGITGNKTSGYAVKTSPSDYTNRPVVHVSWYGAVAYCNWLSDRTGLERCYDVSYNMEITKKGYRLPTEAEWEYACRAETSTEYYWGEGYPPIAGSGSQIDIHVWYGGNSGGNHHDVGQKTANSYGLYDMSGNVWEWCYDWYGIYSDIAQINPTGPASGSLHIERGGAYGNTALRSRSAYRDAGVPSYRGDARGFRIVRTK